MPCKTLSLQQWSQNSTANANGEGTWSATYFDNVEINQSNNMYHRMTILHHMTITAAICSSAGHLKY